MVPERTPISPEGSVETDQSAIPDFEIDALARCLLPKLRAYYESPEGQAAFEDWKKKQDT
jgi:hypothetical protein